MDINRFTEKAAEAVRAAQTLATRYSNQQIEVEHLLLAMLEQQGGLVPSILTKPAPYSAQALADPWRFSGSGLSEDVALPGF